MSPFPAVAPDWTWQNCLWLLMWKHQESGTQKIIHTQFERSIFLDQPVVLYCMLPHLPVGLYQQQGLPLYPVVGMQDIPAKTAAC
jgi:hypothetical protein